LQSLGPRGSPFNTTGKRTLDTFDLSQDGNHIVNKRPIYLAQDWVPDVMKVAANGYVLAGAGKGVDLIDPCDGAVLVRVQTNFTVQKVAWTGKDFKNLWIVGNSGVARVK